MSTQRGNINRTRKQKHSNKTAFKNSLHDTSRRTQQINSMDITEVCKRCQDVIAWKVKYKKYKPLTQPKTCTKCHQKNIKDAYHIVCLNCAKELQVCCKCGKKEEIVAHKPPSKTEQLQTMAELEAEVKNLSERKRRAYYRYLRKLEGQHKKKKKKLAADPEGEGVGSEGEENNEEEEGEEEATLNMEEYFKNARQKLEQLMKGMEDGEFYEDLEDLKLSSEDEFDDEEEEDSDEES